MWSMLILLTLKGYMFHKVPQVVFLLSCNSLKDNGLREVSSWLEVWKVCGIDSGPSRIPCFNRSRLRMIPYSELMRKRGRGVLFSPPALACLRPFLAV